MDTEYERRTHEVEENHWWYRGRRAILRQTAAELLPAGSPKILDAGCGSGRNMLELRDLGDIYGIDISQMSVDAALRRGLDNVQAGSLTDLPFGDSTFDLVTTFDVIEHIEDDVSVLRELLRVAKPGAALLVTVPAYQWRWSSHDVVNHHVRRYTRKTLLQSATAAGWTPERTTHFNSLLLPPAAAFRLLERLRKQPEEVEETHLDATPGWANGMLEKTLLAEAKLLRGGRRRIPAGLSLMAILRKPA